MSLGFALYIAIAKSPSNLGVFVRFYLSRPAFLSAKCDTVGREVLPLPLPKIRDIDKWKALNKFSF